MKKYFIKHPHSIGETYFQHMRFAASSGFLMLFSGIACIVHAIFPFLMETTASTCLQKLSQRFAKRSSDPVNFIT